MKRLILWTGLGAAMLAMTSTAGAQWSDNFDSYANNVFLPGQGPWEEWDANSANSQTKVKDAAAGAAVRSAPHSIWVRGSSDTIVQFDGSAPVSVGGPYTSGAWTFSGWIYKPTTTTSFVMDIPQFFIMLNQYDHNTTNYNNWSVQMTMSPITGNYVADTETTTYTGPCTFDQWVEVRCEIDLTADTVEVFYNGASVGPAYPWNGGVSGFGTGSNEIACLDLFAQGGLSPSSRVYWDDFKLEAGSGGCSSNAQSYCTSGTSASGCVANLSAVGTSSATASSGFNISATGTEGGNKSGLLYFGTAQKSPATVVGNSSSFQCVNPPVKRSQLLFGGGTNGNCDGMFSVDLNARWAAQPAQNPGAGATMYAQLWYRDPANTSNQTTSRSDALTWSVCP
jgi:hypothetical protein